MRTYLDCIPCFVRHSLDAARIATDDRQTHERILRRALEMAGELDLSESPPATAQKLHRFIRQVTGVADPYLEIKRRFNELALGMYPLLKRRVESSDEPFAAAVRLAIAGNVIDYGTNNQVDRTAVEQAIEESMTKPLDEVALARFRDTVRSARKILYLGDNAGEIVCDRLLIEHMDCSKITFVVKGGPILNDALLEDARMAGLTGLVEVIDNGSDAPGTILGDCSPQFRRLFEQADMVISKGQGNCETLGDVSRSVFFMLQPKCSTLAEHLGRATGSLVLMYKDGKKESA